MPEQPQVFKYERPETTRMRADPSKAGKTKEYFPLCKSDQIRATGSMITEGGENQLHHHTGNDGFWFVLEGRARYYTDGDAVVAELGKHEGVLIPRGFNYWFESVGEKPLELIHVVADHFKSVTVKPPKS